MTTAFLLLLLAADSGWRPPAEHPFLFLGTEDVRRAREACAPGGPLEAEARALLDSASRTDASTLPRLEREWWAAARDKPWGETYPEIFHHTWIVPARWAEMALLCARAHLLAPGAGHEKRAKEILLGLSDFTFEFRHFDVGMNYTIWCIRALEAYDILHDVLRESERERMSAFLGRYLDAVRENDRYWVEHEPGGPMNNHYAWHKLGIAAFGLFHGKPDLVGEALHGPKGVDEMLDHGFRDDGLWLEGSVPYQLAATMALLRLAEILENARFPERIWGRRSGDGRRLEDSYGALFPLLFPDRTLPTIGDCYGRRPHLGANADWSILARRFQDPRFAWILRDRGAGGEPLELAAIFEADSRLPAGEPPVQVTRLWPESGYAALRTAEGRDYWSGRGWTAFVTFSANLVHSNADKLSLILWGDGHLWLPDAEAMPSAEHSFSARVQGELNRETLCHNTLLVDGRSQRHPDRRLDLVEFQDLAGTKRVTLADLDGRLHPGVRQMRTIVARDEYVLDVIQVRAAEEHDLAWLIHVDGVPEADADAPRVADAGGIASLPSGPPWSYLGGARRLGETAVHREVFRPREASRIPGHPPRCDCRLALDVALDAPAEVVACEFPLDETGHAIPMRMLRSRRDAAWYAAVYRTGTEAALPLRVEVAPDVLESLRVTVTVGERSLRHRIPRLR